MSCICLIKGTIRSSAMNSGMRIKFITFQHCLEKGSCSCTLVICAVAAKQDKRQLARQIDCKFSSCYRVPRCDRNIHVRGGCDGILQPRLIGSRRRRLACEFAGTRTAFSSFGPGSVRARSMTSNYDKMRSPQRGRRKSLECHRNNIASLPLHPFLSTTCHSINQFAFSS